MSYRQHVYNNTSLSIVTRTTGNPTALQETLRLTGLGLALGLGAALAGTRMLTTVLFQVRPSDPLVYLAVAVLLGVVAVVASYVPAWRASRIDPLAALRQE
jgi:ABC-type antimicrobial peptide transport system permease subunit